MARIKLVFFFFKVNNSYRSLHETFIWQTMASQCNMKHIYIHLFLNFSLIIYLKEEKRDQKRGQDRQHKYKQKY